MWPNVLKAGEFSLPTYGVFHFVAIAALGLWGGWWLGRKGAEPAVAIDAAVGYPLTVFFAGHLAYCLLEFGLTTAALRQMLNFVDGGLWGGPAFLGVFVILYTLLRRFPLGVTLDLLAPPLLLCLGVGRIGCFLGGCCWGQPTEGPFGLNLHPDCTFKYPDGPLHPLPLYDSLWAGGALVILLILSARRLRPGSVFLWFVILYAIGRFLTELLRYDYVAKTGLFGLYLSQFVELGSIAAAVALLVWISRKRKPGGSDAAAASRVRDRAPPEGRSTRCLGRRVAAFYVDLALPSLIAVCGVIAQGTARWILILLAVASYVFGFALLPRSPGQRLLGLELVDRDDAPPHLGRRFARSLLFLLPLVSVVGLCRPCASSSRQSFPDITTGVFVVRRPT